jgi:hypothetical protein
MRTPINSKGKAALRLTFLRKTGWEASPEKIEGHNSNIGSERDRDTGGEHTANENRHRKHQIEGGSMYEAERFSKADDKQRHV